MLEVQKQKRVSPFSSKLFSRLIAFTAAFLVFALLFGSMFQMFESISMQAMLRMNEEFSAQASTISDSMQSIINTLGIQMFYISSTAKLRKSTSLTQNERVFALRELWQYAMSGSMLHSIYVFNPKLDYVYTTDNDYMSASMDGFYDQDAVALYRQRSPENRMRLYHRTFRENGEDYGSEWYSYLVYEVTASGKTGESAVMLNLNADWFREHLLNFQGENYVIVSSDSYVVASQREELNAMSLSLLGRIGEQKRGYLIERLNGKRTICFFSPLDVNDWYCLRYVAYADCLPGLAKIRSYAWIALTLIACALLSALGVALIRVYDPYRRMTAALNRTHEVENVQQAAEQVEKTVTKNMETTVFLLSNALVRGDYSKAYALLDLLMAQREEPYTILAVLSSAYIDMYRVRAAIESGKTSMAPTEYGDYRGRDFRLKYAERDVRDLSIEMLRECLSLLLNCDLSIKLSGGENMDRIALEKLFAQLLYVAHRGSVA